MTMQGPLRKIAMKIPGTRGSALDLARSRLVFVAVCFILCYVFIAVRLFDVAVLQGELQRDSMNVSTPAAPVRTAKFMRADIVDRNGILLATSLDTPSLYADPAMIADPAQAAKALIAAIPDLKYDDVLQRLQRKGRFVWIKRNLTPDEQYKVLMIGEPGFAFRNERRRLYPQGPLAAHIVGYTDVDGGGLAGVERSFDSLLRKGGHSLALSIDMRVQHILRREMQAQIKQFSATGGAAIVMDVQSGEIIAAVSLPDFDPHNPAAAKDAEKFNRLTLGVYELGSTFKLFSTAAYLEKSKGNMAATFDAREPLKRGRFSIRDYHPEKRVLTVPEVFLTSSNIGAALMAEAVGTQELYDFYADLGLMRASPVALEEVGRPLIPQPWRDINALTASYGHGMAVSPLQLTSAASSLLGDGVLITPLILRKDVQDAVMQKNDQNLRIVSPQTVNSLRGLMRLTVTDGTGKSADVAGYMVGGKTGTAEQPGPRGYDRKRLISSFLGVFPSQEPRYVVYVMVQEPQGTRATHGYATGGWVGAPVMRRVVEVLGPMTGLHPEETRSAQDIAAPLKKYIKVKGAPNAAR